MVNVEEAKREWPVLDWQAILPELWFAQPENTVGGWCVTLDRIDGTPADGNPPIASFTTEDAAKHIARLHNDWVMYIRASGIGKEPDDINSNSEPPKGRPPES